jgi:hypothetical protein
VPGRSIAGVRIETTDHQVQAKLGKPNAHPTAPKGYRIWDYTRRDKLWLRVVLDHRKHVVELYTTSNRERTKEGIGVRSTEAQLKGKLQGEHCSAHVGRYGRGCLLGSLKRGRFTIFELSPRGLVNEVVVGEAGAPP